MSGLRDKVFDAMNTDAQLLSLLGAGGIIFPQFAVDSPAESARRWITLRWGAAEEFAGRDTSARPIALTISGYDRERNFSTIEAMLKRIRYVLRALEGQPTGTGWVIDVGYPQLSSEDGWDDIYAAVVRSETYRIVASGT